MTKKKLFVLHTVPNFMDVNHKPYGIPFLAENPDIVIENMLDTSLLNDTVAYGSVPPSVSARILTYVREAQRAGADMFLLTCTSVDAGMKYVTEFTDLPTLCISSPMVKTALDLGNRIGIVGTVPTSPPQSLHLWKRKPEPEAWIWPNWTSPWRLRTALLIAVFPAMTRPMTGWYPKL